MSSTMSPFHFLFIIFFKDFELNMNAISNFTKQIKIILDVFSFDLTKRFIYNFTFSFSDLNNVYILRYADGILVCRKEKFYYKCEFIHSYPHYDFTLMINNEHVSNNIDSTDFMIPITTCRFTGIKDTKTGIISQMSKIELSTSTYITDDYLIVSEPYKKQKLIF